MDAAMLGMWTFLITEVLFFGGMFAAYAIYREHVSGRFRQHQPVHGRDPGRNQYGGADLQQLDHGAGRTRGAAQQAQRDLILFLILTMIFGTVFLVIKGFEYHSKWVEHLVPGFDFQYDARRSYRTTRRSCSSCTSA